MSEPKSMIENLCEWVDVPGNIPTEVRANIIAALRAGQALSVAAQEVLDVDLYGGYERRLREAVEAWDAATKGDGR